MMKNKNKPLFLLVFLALFGCNKRISCAEEVLKGSWIVEEYLIENEDYFGCLSMNSFEINDDYINTYQTFRECAGFELMPKIKNEWDLKEVNDSLILMVGGTYQTTKTEFYIAFSFDESEDFVKLELLNDSKYIKATKMFYPYSKNKSIVDYLTSRE